MKRVIAIILLGIGLVCMLASCDAVGFISSIKNEIGNLFTDESESSVIASGSNISSDSMIVSSSSTIKENRFIEDVKILTTDNIRLMHNAFSTYQKDDNFVVDDVEIYVSNDKYNEVKKYYQANGFAKAFLHSLLKEMNIVLYDSDNNILDEKEYDSSNFEYFQLTSTSTTFVLYDDCFAGSFLYESYGYSYALLLNVYIYSEGA